MEKELPEGWEKLKFNEVAEATDYVSNGSFESLSKNVTALDTPDFGILVRLKDFNNNWKGNFKYVTEESFNFLSNSTLIEGDLFIANVGDPGKLFIVPELGMPMTIGPNGLRIRSNEKTSNKFLSYYYLSDQGKSQLQEITSGTAQQKFNKTGLRNSIVILPPLPEQQRIVAKLDSLFAHLETAKQGLEKIPVLLKQFRQAVLTQAVTGKLTEEFQYKPALSEIIVDKKKFWDSQLKLQHIKKIPVVKNKLTSEATEKLKLILFKKFDIANFDEISAPIANALKAGPFGSSLKKEYYVSKGYKIYGQEQVIKDDPFYGDYYIDENRFNTLKSCEVNSGDILISLVGTIGKVLIIPNQFEKGIINPRLVKLSLHKNINPYYIKFFLQSDFVINHLKDQSHGGTMDVLNLGILRELPIPIPSFEEQTEIVRRVEALFAKADAIEARYKVLKEKIDNLPQAVLAKAFRGEV